MAQIDFQQLHRHLESGKMSPIYALIGEELFLQEEALNAILEKTLDPAGRDFNLDVFYAPDDDSQKVRDAVETLPMMCERRVVVYKMYFDVKAADLEVLFPLLQNPVSSTVFILVMSSQDKRQKFFKLLNEAALIVPTETPMERDLPQWVKHMAKKLGKTLSVEAEQELTRLVGTRLTTLWAELKKVAQFVGDRTTVEREDVNKVVSNSRVESVFDFTKALGARDRAQALTCLANLFGHDESAIGITALIARHFRILLLVKEAIRDGLSNSQVAARAGVPPYFVRQYLDQCQSWTEPQLEKTYNTILQTDRALKTSPVSAHIWLENLVVGACQLRESSL